MKRSKFSLSHTKLLSCDLGELVPVACMEVLPGDAFQQSSMIVLRCSPMLAPVFHPVDVRCHHFFVPYRLLWPKTTEDTGWESFITGGPDGDNADTPPYIQAINPAVGTLADYLGMPVGVAAQQPLAFPFRAYAMIWNEYYRDQDLQTPLTISLAAGGDTTTSVALQNCAWEKDYFTASRPWEQKGPSITLPLGTTAPLIIDPASGAIDPSNVRVSSTGALAAGVDTLRTNASGVLEGTTAGVDYSMDVTPHTLADLSNASAVTVNALREALALQRFEEARARYGSRYVEYLRYLGVRSSDARLQRPEYLGGGRQTIQFSEVLQTGPGTDPVGDLKGHGIATMRSNRYRRHFEEHGLIMSLMSVRPKTMYMNGLPRKYNKFTKEEYWQKELEHIGQQEISRKEIYAASVGAEPFGYTDRYAEYRGENSTVSGEFRTVLNHWHFARSFGSEPSLNADFVKCVPPETPFAVPSEDVLWCMVRHSIQARRLVSRSAASFIL